MLTFIDLGLGANLLKGIEKLGFKEPTPVQAKIIPLLLKNERDLVALAQTGTGKTAAFGLPLLQLVDAAKKDVQALILCPSRELCIQIAKDLAAFSHFAQHLRILPVYGGSSINVQMNALYHGVHIVVATPGRMNDLLRRGAVSLEKVERVVLDEADEMLTMGFQDELESILKEVPETAQKLLFSATMSKQVATIALRYMKDPTEITVGVRNSGSEQVTHECYTVHAKDRYQALRRIIDTRPDFYGIIFCRTRMVTQEIAELLHNDNYLSDALHGDLSQDQRDKVMRSFRQHKIRILVATDVASRGIDVTDITHIVNFDLPDDAEVYTHRSGRTGRAGKFGISIVLANLREHHRIRTIENIIKKRFEHKKVPTAKEVCDCKLKQIIDKLVNMETADKELSSYMPTIMAALEDMSRENLIKRLMTPLFGEFVKTYSNSPDLNLDLKRNEPKNFEKREHIHHSPETEMVTVHINLGRRDAITPPMLISLINRATHGPKLLLGRIKISDSFTDFEVVASGAKKLTRNLCNLKHQNKEIAAAMVSSVPQARQETQTKHKDRNKQTDKRRTQQLSHRRHYS